MTDALLLDAVDVTAALLDDELLADPEPPPVPALVSLGIMTWSPSAQPNAERIVNREAYLKRWSARMLRFCTFTRDAKRIYHVVCITHC